LQSDHVTLRDCLRAHAGWVRPRDLRRERYEHLFESAPCRNQVSITFGYRKPGNGPNQAKMTCMTRAAAQATTMRFSTTRRRPGGLRAPWPLPPSRRGVESANAQSFLENDTAGEETEARDNAGHRSGRRTQAGLNKGEARNALARALFFNQLGELRDRRFENQSYRASGLNLLVAAIILWNTRYLEQALADMGTPNDMVRPIAPLGWEHISLTGDYSWERDDRPGPDQLRPLRTSPSLLAA